MKKSNWKLIAIVAAAVLAVVLLLVVIVQSSQNKAFSLEEQVNTAESDIKVQEKRRVDLVYNLADCVKEYDKHEADVLKAIVDGRGPNGGSENVTTVLNAVSEAYPELKSSENYRELMNELAMTENLIAEHRSNYNKQVKAYNETIDETAEHLQTNGTVALVLFWFAWTILIAAAVIGFVYLDNRWLE